MRGVRWIKLACFALACCALARHALARCRMAQMLPRARR
jgi:hypothetical protein